MNSSEQWAKSPAVLVVSVVDQGKGTLVIKSAKSALAVGGFVVQGQGTASQEIWERLGITKAREVVFCVTVISRMDEVMHAIYHHFEMKNAGHGIVFALSIDKFGSLGLIKHVLMKAKESGLNIPELTEDNRVEEIKQKVENMMNRMYDEKKTAEDECESELIVVRMASGYGQEVMDCARKAGAKGGTIIHGRSSVDSPEVKFFNITIEPGCDILFMLAGKDCIDNVLCAIHKEFGPLTAAHAIAMVLPVLKVMV